ncbi:hypothetical protein KEH51_14085 [[Brevibacterium] frigoritolerans]|uniref:Uncharacterized protein n=1 Tax=Peribacillus frigoritolerans TaxID=450367 RepID=A0A941J5H3_9BACI|nr:hypothetical protein [Peribacillus frigoritolerans]
MSKYLVACLASVLLFLSGGSLLQRRAYIEREVLSLIHDAMENQVSISEEVRSKEAIEGKLENISLVISSRSSSKQM